MTWLDDALADGRLTPDKIGVVDVTAPALWRVHPQPYGPAGFNATGRGDARFSPLMAHGSPVPTLYAATTLEAALMETVFHDAPSPSHGFHLVLAASREIRRVARLQASRPLCLIDLSAVGLRRLGLRRAHVIDGDPDGYSLTRRLALWLFEHRPDAHGMFWSSRQDDTAQAMMLFGSRLGTSDLSAVTEDEPFTSGPHLEVLLRLAERLGVGVLIR